MIGRSVNLRNLDRFALRLLRPRFLLVSRIRSGSYFCKRSFVMKDSYGQEQDVSPSLIREDRIRKIHAERFPDDSEKIARSRNNSTKTAKSRHTEVSRVAKLRVV